jgi:hypothetical protein
VAKQGRERDLLGFRTVRIVRGSETSEEYARTLNIPSSGMRERTVKKTRRVGLMDLRVALARAMRAPGYGLCSK